MLIRYKFDENNYTNSNTDPKIRKKNHLIASLFVAIEGVFVIAVLYSITALDPSYSTCQTPIFLAAFVILHLMSSIIQTRLLHKKTLVRADDIWITVIKVISFGAIVGLLQNNLNNNPATKQLNKVFIGCAVTLLVMWGFYFIRLDTTSVGAFIIFGLIGLCFVLFFIYSAMYFGGVNPDTMPMLAAAGYGKFASRMESVAMKNSVRGQDSDGLYSQYSNSQYSNSQDTSSINAQYGGPGSSSYNFSENAPSEYGANAIRIENLEIDNSYNTYSAMDSVDKEALIDRTIDYLKDQWSDFKNNGESGPKTLYLFFNNGHVAMTKDIGNENYIYNIICKHVMENDSLYRLPGIIDDIIAGSDVIDEKFTSRLKQIVDTDSKSRKKKSSDTTEETPGQGVAGQPGQGVAGQPGQGVAGQPGQGVAGQPGQGVVGQPGQGVAGQPSFETDRSGKIVFSKLLSNENNEVLNKAVKKDPHVLNALQKFIQSGVRIEDIQSFMDEIPNETICDITPTFIIDQAFN